MYQTYMTSSVSSNSISQQTHRGNEIIKKTRHDFGTVHIQNTDTHTVEHY